MATFKAQILEHQKRRDGTYNIKIRVCHNRKVRYIATPWYVGKEDITKSLRIKNQKYIDLTDALIKKYRSICDGKGMQLPYMTIEQVVELLNRKEEDDKPFDLDFVEYVRKYADKIESEGHAGNASRYRVAISSIVRYTGREHVSIFEITVPFLKAWTSWIVQSSKGVRTGEPAVFLYTVTLKTMYARAKREFNDEDAGIIRIPSSPFERFGRPVLPIPDKRALTKEELRKVLEYVPEKPAPVVALAQDVFMLSFCLIGMNPADLYNCTDYKDGRLTYQRMKTRDRRRDKAEISIKVEPEIGKLMERYRDPLGKRVFNFYLRFSSPMSFDNDLNRGLHAIEKGLGMPRLQFYAARHTWATLAVNDVGIDKYTVHEALNHVDPAMKITDVYIRKSWKNIDKANRAVLDYVFQDKEPIE